MRLLSVAVAVVLKDVWVEATSELPLHPYGLYEVFHLYIITVTTCRQIEPLKLPMVHLGLDALQWFCTRCRAKITALSSPPILNVFFKLHLNVNVCLAASPLGRCWTVSMSSFSGGEFKLVLTYIYCYITNCIWTKGKSVYQKVPTNFSEPRCEEDAVIMLLKKVSYLI